MYYFTRLTKLDFPNNCLSEVYEYFSLSRYLFFTSSRVVVIVGLFSSVEFVSLKYKYWFITLLKGYAKK